MFNFVKKIKDTLIKPKEAAPSAKVYRVSKKILAEEEQQLKELLDGKDSYKIFSWGFGLKDGRHLKDKVIPLKDWESVEKVLDILAKEYPNIEEGGMMLKIKDTRLRSDGDEIASLQIQIAHGYMRPYLKYREEGAEYAEEEKEYWANRPWEQGDALEFEYDLFIPLWHLTKDINLIKTLFKEFYETGDVSEKYMH